MSSRTARIRPSSRRLPPEVKEMRQEVLQIEAQRRAVDQGYQVAGKSAAQPGVLVKAIQHYFWLKPPPNLHDHPHAIPITHARR